MNDHRTIAVVGGGVAGITACFLLQEKHDVTLFEKNGYLGGHTCTFTVPSGPDCGLPIDMGFIVLNDRTYPNFRKFLSRLDVETQETDMSFSYYCKSTGLQYGSSGFDSLLAQRRNLLDPGYLRFLFDVVRFFRVARAGLAGGSLSGLTLEDFVKAHGFSSRFVNQYLLPMSAAIWSASDRDMKQFPMEAFARFYENHGLLSVNEHPQWSFVKGGSQSYVSAFLKQFPGEVRKGSPVAAIRREETGVRITTADGTWQPFDAVIIAAHADEALAMIEDPSEEERDLLRPWRYSRNTVILHTDESLLPPNPRARSSWNTIREHGHDYQSPVTVTYDMTRLQRLATDNTYCVTLNPACPIPEEHILDTRVFTHPVFDFAAMKTQPLLARLNGRRNTFFCGSYFGYGFHEDAVRSSVDVGRQFGALL